MTHGTPYGTVPHRFATQEAETMAEDGQGLRDRLAPQSEDALGKLANDLLENQLIYSAITRAFSARERAAHAQEAAMGALNLPSAADIDKLTKRVRSVSGRIEGVEDALDRLEQSLSRLGDRVPSADDDRL